MTLTIIVVSYNAVEMLRACLRSLYACGSAHTLEVVVVDNQSADGSAAMVAAEFPQAKLIANDWNAGFAAANNQAWEQAAGDVVFLLNPDAEVRPGSFDAAVAFLEAHPRAGMVGGKLLNPGGGLEPSARRFPSAWGNFVLMSGLADRFRGWFGKLDYKDFDHASAIRVDWVPGTFTALRRTMLAQIGFFDPRFYLYYEETDLCLRAQRAGWEVWFIPDAEVVHIGGGCSRKRRDEAFDEGGAQVLRFRLLSQYQYFRKNAGLLSVLANWGVETGWHALRWLANLRPGDRRAAKRRYSRLIVRHAWRALRESRLGSYCPPVPW